MLLGCWLIAATGVPETHSNWGVWNIFRNLDLIYSEELCRCLIPQSAYKHGRTDSQSSWVPSLELWSQVRHIALLFPKQTQTRGGTPGLPLRLHGRLSYCSAFHSLSFLLPPNSFSISKLSSTAVTQNLSILEQKFSKYTETNPRITEFHKKRIYVWGGITIHTNPCTKYK